MPLQTFHQDGKQSGWALWHITETEDELMNNVIGKVPDEITNDKKRLEWLAGRHLMLALCNHLGLRYFGIKKDEFGKPYLEKYPHHISLSHSYPYVAAQIDHDHPVGIDIEQPREKLLSIAPRILSAKELFDAGNDLAKHCVYWCAKEAMYKIHGEGGLHFAQHIAVNPFPLKPKGNLIGKIFTAASSQEVSLDYFVEKDFVMVVGKVL